MRSKDIAEPFNVEKFRQKMRGQPPIAPQTQQPPLQQAVQQQIPQPLLQPQQVQRQMPVTPQAPMSALQHMPPPMPQNMPQNYAVQPQPMAQTYTQPVAGQAQAQAWTSQAPAVPAPQMMQPHMMPPQAGAPYMQQMPQAAVFAPLPSDISSAEIEEPSPKKSRFSLKWTKKEKAPKVEKIKEDIITNAGASKRSSAMIFMLGMAAGMACFLVGNMVISNIFTNKPQQNLADIQAATVSLKPSVTPAIEVGSVKELSAAVEER